MRRLAVLNEDMILLTFPFSAVVPAALEARNKLLPWNRKQSRYPCVVRVFWVPQASWVSGGWEVGFRGSGNNCCKAKAARVETTQVTAAQLAGPSVQE